MQTEGDFMAPALFNVFDGKEERVDELFLDDNSIAILEGLIESKSNAELISPEDLAWVDSCLVADPELYMENWDSLNEALLDSITTFSVSYEESNAADRDKVSNGEQMEVDAEEVLRKPEVVNDQVEAAHVRARVNRTAGDDHNVGEEEVLKEIELPDMIFRVWEIQEEKGHELIPELTRAVAELQVVQEEDQLLTELHQAVAESILKDKQRVAADEATTAEDRKLDELISSMGDLSLKISSK